MKSNYWPHCKPEGPLFSVEFVCGYVSLTVWRKLSVIIRYFPSTKLCLFLSLCAHKRSSPFFYTYPIKNPLLNRLINLLSLVYAISTATSANVGFSHVVQLLAPSTNPATHLAEKIPFWATVSKKVRPMLSVRCLSVCPVGL